MASTGSPAIPEYVGGFAPAQTRAFPVSIRGHDPHFKDAFFKACQFTEGPTGYV